MNDIIIDVGLNQDRVALLENNELVELYIERVDNKRKLGNIYKGRVVNVLPGMQAAFVDIGIEKNAFLYVKDAIHKNMISDRSINLKDISIKDVVKQGQEIIVQVIKEPYNSKGARITTHITLPGRDIVLMTCTNYVGVSRRITNEGERDRLKSIAEEIKTNDMGVILRTVSEGKSKQDLKDDLDYLLKVHQKIEKDKKLGFAPRIIYRDLDLVHRTVRDLFTTNIDRLIINDSEKYRSILDFVELISPHLKSKVKFYDGGDIFGYYGIEPMIKSMIEHKVWLESGGYIVIDETEALTSIDVNTGKYVGNIDLEHTVVKTNLEAAKEIAKQLRLRNIGGIIIIDFIDMNNEKDEKRVLECLENELKKDRIKSTILGITQLGLVEMTRKKNRNRVISKMLTECPYCKGTGKVYSEHTILNFIENQLKRMKNHTNTKAVLIKVNPLINDMFYNNYSDSLSVMEEKYSIELYLRPEDSLNFNEIKIKSLGSIEGMEKLIAKQ